MSTNATGNDCVRRHTMVYVAPGNLRKRSRECVQPVGVQVAHVDVLHKREQGEAADKDVFARVSADLDRALLITNLQLPSDVTVSKMEVRRQPSLAPPRRSSCVVAPH